MASGKSGRLTQAHGALSEAARDISQLTCLPGVDQQEPYFTGIDRLLSDLHPVLRDLFQYYDYASETLYQREQLNRQTKVYVCRQPH
jgi:hypothetical protein